MLIAILTLGALSGCGNKTESKKKIKIVATTFPQYDWIREILGDKAKDVDLKLLQKSGGDLHSFQPSADDIKAVADADIFVYVGGESDKWVSDVLKKKTNKNPTSRAASTTSTARTPAPTSTGATGACPPTYQIGKHV